MLFMGSRIIAVFTYRCRLLKRSGPRTHYHNESSTTEQEAVATWPLPHTQTYRKCHAATQTQTAFSVLKFDALLKSHSSNAVRLSATRGPGRYRFLFCS